MFKDARNGSLILIPKNSGYANGFNHLKSCIANGDRDKFIAIYEQNLKLKQTSVFDFFEPTLPAKEKEMEIVDWMKYIIEKDLSISSVVDKTFHSFKKSVINFG